MHFLSWIESWTFCTWVRESGSVWSEPMFLFFHTLGMCLIAGVSAVIDLSFLGFWPKMVSVKPLERLYPVMWTGFWINAVTGTILLLADATTKVPSIVFWTKMVFVFAGVWILIVMRRRIFGFPDLDMRLPNGAKTLAILSIVCWLGAIEAGRLMAYLGPVSGLSGISNH